MKIRLVRALTALAAAWLVPGCIEEVSSSQGGLLAPTGLSAVAQADGAAIQLTWTDNSSSESSFRIDVSDIPIATDVDVTEWTTVPADVTAYTYTATPKATRYFRVLAITPLHQSAPSNVAVATTPDVPPAPGRVEALTSPDGSNDYLSVVWDDVANETSYEVQRTNDGTFWSTMWRPVQNATSILDVTPIYTHRYAFRVRGINAAGSGVWASSGWIRARNRSWERLSANSIGDVSWNLSLAVDAGTAVVAAYNSSYGDIVQGLTTYADSTLSATTLQPGFPESLGFGSTSVAVDAAGRHHIVAADAFNDVLYHLSNENGGVWQADVVDTAADDDKAVIRKAPDGTLRVVYQHQAGSTRGLRHAVRSGSAWISEWITSVDSTDYFDFAIDASGVSHVVYRRSLGSGLHDLAHVWKAPSSAWGVEALATQADPEMCSLATDASSRLYVAYNSTVSGALHLLTDVGGTWAGETVHRTSRGSWGRHNSIVIGAKGEIHIAYYGGVERDLWYAARLPGAPWRLELVDEVGDVGRYACIGRDPSFGLFIAYGDATNGRMKVAKTYLKAPTGLTATPITPGQYLVTWNDSPNETWYHLQRSGDGGASWAVVGSLYAGTTSYLDTGANPARVALYRMYAHNDFNMTELVYSK